MDEKFYRRFLSFCKSLDALAEARQRDLTDSFVLSGTSAKFSITFDLAWKVMKDILIQYYAITGFVSGSPREVLREAFKANLISDEAWMNMLKVRNELTHDYDCEIVKTHCNTIVEKYIDLFYDFEKVVKVLPSGTGKAPYTNAGCANAMSGTLTVLPPGDTNSTTVPVPFGSGRYWVRSSQKQWEIFIINKRARKKITPCITSK